ncbi:MAG: carbohydrate binding domain-containing protein, partial [Planctomycetes bacterium]|nr:carbohydrate binding domain-containing protein [Planctomycetota bacterium]
MRLACIALLVALAAGTAAAQEMVPFVIPMTPSEKSLIAFKSAPIAVDGPRMAIADGHFAVAGKRFRVWGVNTCFGADFPAHADAERIAARLAAGGVNSVRFHHMDTQAWPNGILDPKDPLKLFPEAVERLDYFIDQLARRGIYANINLHVGRGPAKALGLPDSGLSFDKIVGLFTPALIDAQKQYARDLLTHVNPYRKVRYADDPAVGFVEITNEDSLFMWSAKNDLQSLPEFYAKILREKYAAWLKAQYGSTDGLRTAWGKGTEALGENVLVPGEILTGNDAKKKGWRLEQHEGSTAKLVKQPDGSLRIEITKADETNWHLQVKQVGLAVKGGQYYSLSFRARADQPRTVGYGVQQDEDPWNNLGLSGTARLTKEWKTFRDGFTANRDSGVSRLSFSVGGTTTGVELADVSLAPGGREGLLKDETLENATVALFAPGEMEARAIDRIKFLAETERAFFDGMYAFIKKDLGTKALVTGTIAFGAAALHGQGGMDYIDGHSYWQHPNFPGRPWDSNNWVLEQKAMVDNPAGSTLPRLSGEKVEGKPYTVSEYNHSAPNDFQAECVPLMAAWAAAQDWDGIWFFSYSHRRGDVDREFFNSYFDIDANPSKWGFMQTGAAIFREGALPPLRRAMSLSLGNTENMLTNLAALQLKYDMNVFASAGAVMKLGWEDLLQKRLEVALEGHSGVVDSQAPVEANLAWKVEKGLGTFSAAGPGAVVLVSHAGGTEAAAAEGVQLAKPGFAAITVAALDGLPIEKSKAVLVA